MLIVGPITSHLRNKFAAFQTVFPKQRRQSSRQWRLVWQKMVFIARFGVEG